MSRGDLSRSTSGVFGEVDANLIDGSSIWLQSICLTLARLPRARVTLLLRSSLRRQLVVGPLLGDPRVRVVEPTRWRDSGPLTPMGAVLALAELDAEDQFHHVMLRGAGVSAAAAAHGGFDGRIWLYHVPVAGEEGGGLAKIAATAHKDPLSDRGDPGAGRERESRARSSRR